jgi:hypothetical protein
LLRPRREAAGPRARDRASSEKLAGTVAAELRRGRHRRGLRALPGVIGRSTSGESGAMPPKQGDGHMLYTKAARFTDLDDAIEKLFEDVQLEIVCCELCGDYHPPDIHMQPITPYDGAEPEEA